MPRRQHWGKAPEDWSTPRRFALIRRACFRGSVMDCGSPPPLWIHGDKISRCGRWLMAVCKDFQRAKAASLVSANRNFSVGDSTWPSQRTTVALLAAERRETVAHGVSRGFDRQINQAAERRKKRTSIFCRSCRSFYVLNLKPIARAMGYYRTLLRSFRQAKLWRQSFSVRQMVAIPAHQGRVAGIFKQKSQRRRFDVAVAKDHVGFAGKLLGARIVTFQKLIAPFFKHTDKNLVRSRADHFDK